MNTREMKAELTRIDREIRRLQSSIQRLENTKKRVLKECPPDYFTEAQPLLDALSNGRRGDVPGIPYPIRVALPKLLEDWDGAGISQLERQVDSLRDRREVILNSLPSDEEVQAASQRLETERLALQEQYGPFNAAWSAYLESLESAVSTARRVAETKPNPKSLHAINKLMDDYDLPGPREKEQLRDDITLATALTHLLVQVSSTQKYDARLDKEIDAALSRVKVAA